MMRVREEFRQVGGPLFILSLFGKITSLLMLRGSLCFSPSL